MHTFLSSYCLQAMGIQIWHQSGALSHVNPPLDFEAYALYNTSHQKIGILCLEILLMKAEQQTPFFHLLDAMLSAIKLKRAPLLDNHMLQEGSLILLMGESLAQKALDSSNKLDILREGNMYAHASGAKLLVTYHPLDLLTDATQKVKAWGDLKKLL